MLPGVSGWLYIFDRRSASIAKGRSRDWDHHTSWSRIRAHHQDSSTSSGPASPRHWCGGGDLENCHVYTSNNWDPCGTSPNSECPASPNWSQLPERDTDNFKESTPLKHRTLDKSLISWKHGEKAPLPPWVRVTQSRAHESTCSKDAIYDREIKVMVLSHWDSGLFRQQLSPSWLMNRMTAVTRHRTISSYQSNVIQQEDMLRGVNPNMLSAVNNS